MYRKTFLLNMSVYHFQNNLLNVLDNMKLGLIKYDHFESLRKFLRKKIPHLFIHFSATSSSDTGIRNLSPLMSFKSKLAHTVNSIIHQIITRLKITQLLSIFLHKNLRMSNLLCLHLVDSRTFK